MFKKCLVIVLTVALLLALWGCSTTTNAEKAFAGAMDSLKNNDQEAFERYFEEETYEGPSTDSDETLLLLFYENLTYKIISSEKEGTVEHLEVEITNLDLASIVPQYVAAAISLIVGPEYQELSHEEKEQQIDEILIDLIEDLEETTTSTVTVTVVKGDDNNWRVRADDALMDAVFGGMISEMDDL